MDRTALPIDPFIDEIVAAVRRARALVVSAPPGAGKTTRIPPALAAGGPLILLQPRRVAARSIARRIAAEQGWTIGREVGWQVRFERQFGQDTRLLVATEGILTARFQQDPLLSGFRTVVLDEFHERSIHADLGLALAKQAWIARRDLAIVVMSATLDTTRVSRFLDGCPVVEIPGRAHPIDIAYAPGQPLGDAVVEALGGTDGQVLCFLPGAPEIRRAQEEVGRRLPAAVEVVPLHGSLDADAQDDAIRPASRRRVILATNIAETSLTVPGVTAVVDTGLHKVARYDAARAIDSLETERITQDAADQRAGRAGRVAPGLARRLWDARDRLRPHREPEIARVDLASAVLDLLAWGADPRRFEWFEAPPPDAVDAALALLERLGAVETTLKGRATETTLKGRATETTLKGRATGATLTPLGERLRMLPLHPRLGRILVEARGAREAAMACALIAERHYPWYEASASSPSTTSDLLSAIDALTGLKASATADSKARATPALSHVRRVADEIARLTRSTGLAAGRDALGGQAPSSLEDEAFRRAILAGYPDRVAERRAPGSPRVLLASGHGAVVAPESGVRDGELLVAIDVTAATRGVRGIGAPGRSEASEARIRVASRVERDWLTPTSIEVEHRFDKASGTVRAIRVERYDALVLSERPAAADPETVARLLADAYLARPAPEADARLARRLRFAGVDAERDVLVQRAASAARLLKDIDPAKALAPDVRAALDRLAPETLHVPSGRSVTLDYREDGSVAAAVKLQELFGLAETPRIGPRREPVVFELLAPNGRPVQVTRDLRSFWERTYPAVRKELRGRYPRHPWPDDPWTARPTHRTRRR
jgi:ATP-dependent helicase HrpB